MKRKRNAVGISILIFAFLLVACSSEPTKQVLTPEMTLTKTSASPTPNPSLTHTSIAEITPSKTRTPRPSGQPTLTSTPTTTDIAWTSSVALPGWARDRDTPVLLGLYSHLPNYWSGPLTLAIWNGLTGERFDLNPPDIYGYYWLPDGHAFGLLSKDLTKAWEVDLARGLVTTLKVPASSVQFTPADKCGLEPLKVFSIAGQSGFIYRSILDDVSPDGRFVREGSLVVYDSYLGETFDLEAPNSQLFTIMASWSPVEPYLAVLRSDVEPGIYFHTDRPANWSIAIYDVVKRQLLEVYQNLFWVNWSPDGTKFLYQPPAEEHVWSKPMCIFDRFTGASKCFETPFTRHKADWSTEISFHSLRWLPDSDGFSYLYYTYGFSNGNENRKAGICFLSIEDGSERCILEQIEPYEGMIGDGPPTVIGYWPSPDWKAILFHVDTACPLCDYSDSPRLGFVNIQTGQFVLLDVYIEDYNTLWRP